MLMLASLNVFSVAHEHNRIRVVKSSSVVKSRFLNFFFSCFDVSERLDGLNIFKGK